MIDLIQRHVLIQNDIYIKSLQCFRENAPDIIMLSEQKAECDIMYGVCPGLDN